MTLNKQLTDPAIDNDIGYLFCVRKYVATPENTNGSSSRPFEFKRQLWPVPLEDIIGPVACCRKPAAQGNYDILTFADYNFTSNRGLIITMEP